MATQTQAGDGDRFTSKLDLASLGAMSIGELTGCYRDGRLPRSLRVLDGAPRGRMLTIAGPLGRGALRRAVQQLAASRFFPWRGKSFRSRDDEKGDGVNRVALLGGRYPFDTSFAPSAIDGSPCILLDYDKPTNPFFIRAIRDELREVAPGLFLGPAMVNVGGSVKLALYFAITTS